jgi:hypothetical protein
MRANLTARCAASVTLASIALLATINTCSIQAAEAARDNLERIFRNPPREARIRTYAWHWINGHVTKEGITADLKNMARAGFVGAVIYFGGNEPSMVGEREPNEKEAEFIRLSGAVAASKSPYISEKGPVEYMGEDCKPGVLAFDSGRFTGRTKSGRDVAAEVAVPAPITIEGSWTLAFDPELGGPSEPVVFENLTSLHEHADPRIKYYSGSTSYKRTIDIPATMLGESKRLMLDLGRVAELAEVRLNGQPVAVAWCAPMAVELTAAAAKPGANELEIIAVNKWRNRWIGDEQLPPDVDTVLPNFGGLNRTPVKFPDWAKKGEKSPNGRILFSTFMPWTKQDPLEPAGLLGPVTMRCGVEKELR